MFYILNINIVSHRIYYTIFSYTKKMYTIFKYYPNLTRM